jgi:acetolactate synthase-1/2/3 large subunit
MEDLISNQLVKYLEARGVEHVFGLCGHTNIAVLAALSKSTKIKFINTRHEQIAAHAADGYARATRRASVVLSHLSPGLTNAATGVANASLDSIPMVVIAGDVPTHFYGKHPHQEVNLHADASQHEIYRPFVKRAWRVDSPHLFPEILEKAFNLAESGRPGPVLIDVPMDIFSTKIDVALFTRVLANTRQVAKPSMDEATAERIVHQLLEAKTPLLYVGGGILLAGATTELRELAEHLQLPVAHTLMGKGALPDDNPLILGMTGFWGTKFINDKCKGADWILALGTRFSEADCSSWEAEYTFGFPPTRLIQIDIDPTEIGRNYPVAIGAIADLKSALTVLLRVARRLVPGGVKRPELLAEMAANRAAFVAGNRSAMESSAWPMRPERILADLRSALPRNSIICTDVGWNKNGLAQQYPVYEPGSIFTPGGFATMGFGSPAALGAKIALPDRVVVALVGDGGFGQNPAGHGLRGGHRGHLGDHEQPCVRDDRRPRAGPLRHHVRHPVREERRDLLARLRRHRQGLWRRRHPGGVGGGTEAGDRARDPAQAAGGDRRLHEERPDPDGRSLEHHGHLLARTESASCSHRPLSPEFLSQ